MAFAGHAKSISLHQSSCSEPYENSLARSSQIEKEELHDRLRIKIQELKKLKTAFHQPSTQKASHSVNKDTADESADEDGSGDDGYRSSTLPIDDRGNPPSRSLWIGNTPPGITTTQLRAKFGKYGMIESTKCLKDYSFVNFEEVDSAILAWKACHEEELFEHGRPLWIRFTVTQAESRKSKDWKDDRKMSGLINYNAAIELRQRQVLDGRSIGLANRNEDGTKWPNGPPPLEPKSHRRDISPPPFRRADMYRPTPKQQHDVYRPEKRCPPSAASSIRPDWPNQTQELANSEKCSSPSVTEHCSASPTSHHSSPSRYADSPLPWERSTRKRKLDETDSLAIVTNSVADSATLKQSVVTDMATLEVGAATTQRSAQHDKSKNGPRYHQTDQVCHENDEKAAPRTDTTDLCGERLLPLHQTQMSEHNNCALSPSTIMMTNSSPYQLHKSHASASLSDLQSSSMLLSNKRLKLEKDELGSVCSTTSSLSNISSKDRRCRGCKKLGNDKGLQILYKCATCSRRYHGFCGRPKPYESAERSLFVCGKCLRHAKTAKNEITPKSSSKEEASSQSVSPLLQHYKDNDGIDSLIDDSQATSLEVSRNRSSRPFPLSPDAVVVRNRVSDRPWEKMTDDGKAKRHVHRKTTENAEDKLPECARDFEQPENTKNLVQKYKQVTCPWWRKGSRCFLSEDECLYAHRETGISSPDGFKTNRDWTCYFWLHHKPCPRGSNECINAHFDTGLHTTRDGRASLKHITCFWWISRGVCKHQDEECRYAHCDTGLYSRDPSDKRPGNAISYRRPTSFLTRGILSSTDVVGFQCKQASQSEELALNCSFTPQVPSDPKQLHNRAVSAAGEELPHDWVQPKIQQQVVRKAQEYEKGSASEVHRPQIEVRNAREIHSATVQVTKSIPSDIASVLIATRSWSDSSPSLDPDAAPNKGSGARPELQPDSGKSNTMPAAFVPQADSNRQSDRSSSARILAAAQLHLDSLGRNSSRTIDPRRRFDSQAAVDSATIGDQKCDHPTPLNLENSLPRLREKLILCSMSTDATPSEHDSAHVNAQNCTTYNKCKICAKIVFSGDSCRDCRGSKKLGLPKSADLLHSAGSTTDKPASSPIDLQAVDNIIESVKGDVLLATDMSQTTKQSQAPKIPQKRNSISEELFIPNKRPTSSMLFSSSARTQSCDPSASQNLARVARATETVRKPPPPTLNQLLEKRRVENGRTSLHLVPSLHTHSAKTVEISNSQSDKENETPTTEDLNSPLSTEQVEAQVSISKPDTTANINVPLTPDSTSEDQSFVSDTGSISDVSESQQHLTFAEDHDPSTSSACVTVRINDDQEQDTDEDTGSSRPWNKYRCTMCAKKHRRCPHNDKGEESSPGLPKVVQLQVLIAETQNVDKTGQLWKGESLQTVDRLLPYVCSSCRAHHKRCLHAERTQRLDPLKCRQYLRDRGSKRDTSRSQAEWESILHAAKTDEAISLPKPRRMIRQYGNDQAGLKKEVPRKGSLNGPVNFEKTKSFGNINDDVSHLPSEHELIPFAESTLLERSLSIALPQQVVGISVPTGNKTLFRDVIHIQKLENEGVVFESDEDDDDYQSETEAYQAAPGPSYDPLRVRPRQSRDLFQICPELHPKYLRNNVRPKVSRKAEWLELRRRRLAERHKRFGNSHWEVVRHLPDVEVGTLVEQLVPAKDAEVNKFSIPSIEQREVHVLFREFLGAPSRPEACLTSDGTLAFRDVAKDLDHASLARSLRGIGRRTTDDDKFPVSTSNK